MKSKAHLGVLATALIEQLWLRVLREGSYRQGTQTRTKTGLTIAEHWHMKVLETGHAWVCLTLRVGSTDIFGHALET